MVVNETLAVVDGDQNADIYGWACDPATARTIAEGSFVDEIDRVECYGPISLREGGTLDKAFVIFTKN